MNKSKLLSLSIFTAAVLLLVSIFAAVGSMSVAGTAMADGDDYEIEFKLIEIQGRDFFPAPNKVVEYYNSNGVLIDSQITNDQGKVSFSGLSEANSTGTIFAPNSEYYSVRDVVKASDYNAENKAFKNASYDTGAWICLNVDSSDENHSKYNFVEDVYADTEHVAYTYKFSAPKFNDARTYVMAIATYGVSNSGVFSIVPLDLSMGDNSCLYITPCAKEGFVIDYWTITVDDGAPQILKPGQNIVISDSPTGESPKIKLTSSYKAVEEPVPAPEVLNTAQTGDMTNVAVPFAVLMVACCAFAVVSRKREF